MIDLEFGEEKNAVGNAAPPWIDWISSVHFVRSVVTLLYPPCVSIAYRLQMRRNACGRKSEEEYGYSM